MGDGQEDKPATANAGQPTTATPPPTPASSGPAAQAQPAPAPQMLSEAAKTAMASKTANSDVTTQTPSSTGNGEALRPADHQHAAVPTVPARNYPKDPQLLVYRPPPPALLPSRALPRFFKALAFVIFFTGTGATLLTYLYQRFVLPKLALTRSRLAALHQHQLTLQGKMVDAAQTLVSSNPAMYPKTLQLIARGSLSDPTLPSKAQEDIAAQAQEPADARPQSDSEEEEPLFADESPSQETDKTLQTPVQPQDGILGQLQTSLGRLHGALSRYHSNSVPKVTVDDEQDSEGGNNEVLPQQTSAQKTLKSLEDLTSFLTNEAFYASTPIMPSSTYGWNYGTGSQLPQRSGMDREKTAQLKNEIRSLKGMLLTRRNFAAPVRTGG